MSMLTPPGMGGKYRITGDAYPRMRRPRRRRRIVVAALAAVVALGLAGWGTLQLIDVFGGGGADSRARTAAGPGCKPRKNVVTPVHVPLKPAQITVNVYNATPRAGLAKSTADELKKRGFAIGKVGNAPAAYDKKVPGTGMLLGATGARDSAFPVLRTQLKGAALKTDTRATADVDLIIGTAFKTLTPPKDATAALTALAKPAPAPSAKC
ncbi:LytR family transcriptional regulator [Streptomyces sp. WAC05374]|uniref:LytR C-terminal domain-containing protein n=1 Tax=Streptomyces sp. WAC05374 TaxID=2487420 RepID=UPI000F875391|nr:LytR C-terminal domain-containing protein [Streptomyces sp. WAC05374]RST16288.1 LytR family transcriptional regulator [Streptomyces sp. WAC05374]TDF38793.1 LytR family transcriptional regulator [Streptomyces sp. WAC05374]TDF45525.1 LytR family transcriptional regulator [Streptomyces sp. WAC05374]TDF56525.1 LytR family transcriptional regulator [Streptomyces sp. WAC05374]